MNGAISIKVGLNERIFVMSILSKRLLLVFCVLIGIAQKTCALSTLSKSDPYPIFTTLDPQTFLYTREKLHLKGYETIPNELERIGFYASAFGQNADSARDIDEAYTEIGDVEWGRTSMIALLYGDLPRGKTQAPLLFAAQQVLFPGGQGLNDPDYIDKTKRVGFFSFPATYRKRGIRLEFDAHIAGDFGISIQTSLADICQTVTLMLNLTPDGATDNWLGNSGCNRPISKCDINKFLMDELKNIATQINLDIASFHESSIEEVRFNAWWRHAMTINKNLDEYAEFLFIPFLMFSGSVSPGKKRNPNKQFAVPFGNNRFNSIGFTAGVNFDFFDTIEVGGEVGYTHFFKRDCMQLRVPNNLCQSGIFPYSTDVSYQPGYNWHFGAKMNAYHFLDNLSAYFEYMLIQHSPDKICVLNGDPAFKPQVLNRISDWKVHLANFALNYDLSPSIGVGFLWQAPLVQRRVYRSTTVMFGLNFTY